MKTPLIQNTLFRLLAPVIFGLLVYLMLLLLNNQVGQLSTLFRSQEMYICILLAALQFESLRFMVSRSHFSEESSERRRWWLLALAGNGLATSLLLSSLWAYYVYVIGFAPSGSELLRFAGLYLPGGWFYLALFGSQFYLQRQNKAQLEQESEELARLEEEFNDFSAELHPTLLYDALEQLLIRLPHQAADADRYLQLLASHYRHRLINRQEEVIPLHYELEAAETFLALLRPIRRQQLALVYNPLPEVELLLPPGAVFTALYWLLRHGISGENESPIRLQLTDEQLILSWAQPGRLQDDAESSYALARLARSYRRLSNQQPHTALGENEISVYLPLLHLHA